jgi:chromosomal replication initiation ATPase DnaA
MSELEHWSADPASRAAAAAAQAVADGSGVPYAPLVVEGETGSGKSALLDAIAGRLLARHPRAVVERFDPAGLSERQRAAQREGRGMELRAALAGADLLLLDDADRLDQHPEAQGFLTELLDARRAAGRETVVALAPPREEGGGRPGFDPRLLRRLGEGTSVRLTLPGAEARLGLLRRRSAEETNPLGEPVLRALAAAELGSLRDYAGALARLQAFQQASPLPLSPEDALLLLGITPPHLPAPAPRPVPAAPPVRPAPPAPSPPDEFAAFLSEVTAGVAEQVDRWRERLAEAIARHRAAGLITRRLEVLLADELPADPAAALDRFAAEAGQLEALAREAASLAPDLAGAAVFRDPDQLGAARALVAEARARAAPLSAPLAHYRWDDLAFGPASRLVMLACRDIVAEPGRRYSPLLIVGGPGTGKSHLLHGLGNALAERGMGPVACLGAPAFAAELRGLADAEALAAWRSRYRWAGAFLLDDLHLLVEERRAQEELLLLLAELEEGGRQVVTASVRPLEDLAGLDARLAARLHAGLLVELPAPDREVRLAVIKRLLAGAGAGDDAALADFLAARPAESLRAVQGMVQRVLTAAAAQQLTPSPALAREILDVLPAGRRPGRAGHRSGEGRSGIQAPGPGLVRSGEKMVAIWPEIADRLLAELR